VFQESFPCISRDDSEAEDCGQRNEENNGNGDGGDDINPPVAPVVIEERVKSQKKAGRTVGVNEIKGLVSDLGKA